jgi:hypothetical protein
MTPINKSIRRRTIGAHRGRRIIVSLHPGDVIGFREERTRREFQVSIVGAYQWAVLMETQRARAAKRAARKGAA